MAEVSAFSPDQSGHHQTITLAIDNTILGEWTVDSTTVHDKLVAIPAALLTQGQPVTLSLAVQPPANLPPASGLQLHSITFDYNLKAYLDELQTGYHWVCGIRNELLETIRRVLFFYENITGTHDQITKPLQAILQTPYVKARHETRLIFDDNYFHNNFPLLKEGRVHQALRQWAADLQNLQTIVINAGNYASRQPEIRCWDEAGLRGLISPRQETKEQIDELRAKNTTLNDLEILLHKEVLDSVPPVLYLDITNRCNFRCRMCYQSKSHFLRQNLTNAHLAIVMEMLPYLTDITVAGLGEPLLSKNLAPFAEQAKALHCHTTIITNGSLIPGNIQVLKQFSTVSISFDGAEATTFEALRNRSNFNQIVNNIRKLRKEAPEITIAFSVVASRANIDELSGIVQWSADLGVNVINMTPLEHMPIFELKKSDLAMFEAQIARAQEIARRHGITLTLGIGPQNFSDSNDVPRDKETIIRGLLSLKPAPEHEAPPEIIGQEIKTTAFNYYPDPIVFMRPNWPEITDALPESQTSIAKRTNFDINLALARLEEKISTCLQEIHKRPQQSFAIPYCLDPWKLNYVKSNGVSRLCCHADTVVGDLGGCGFNSAINSLHYQRIRRAMAGRETMPTECRKCRAVDRTMGIESLQETCRAYGIHCAV